MKAQNASINIAILRLSSLGDVIVGACVLPFVRAHLSEKYPQGVRLHWIVDSTFDAVLEDSPCIDNLISIPLKNGGIKAIPHIMAQLQNLEPFDILIDMQGLIKSALCGMMSKKSAFWGFAWDSIKEPLASLCYTHKVHISYSEHILKRNLTLVNAALEIKEESKDIFYANRAQAFGVSKQAREQVESILAEASVQNGVNGANKGDCINILLVLEASLESKSYPVDLFIEVIREFLESHPIARILLIQHGTDKAQRIKEHFKADNQVVLLPPISMGALKALMQEVNLVIGGDTGVTHLAWAMQRASLTLYGNTPPQRFALNSPINRFLCGSENPNYKKDDFSIARIAPHTICACAREILDTARITK
ncbi:lipopolysaccharide heptosyltransferase I [Helicobacter typhlonius]|uniref:lipopolysaccharide heptosyltransferase I n=1 Tax=Helicobacter typhlonius TaxID=76936 RepID=UPI002FE25F3D